MIMGISSKLAPFAGINFKPSAVASIAIYVVAQQAVPMIDINTLLGVGYDLELIIKNTGGVVAILVGLQALGLWGFIAGVYIKWRERRLIKKYKRK